MPDKFTEEDKRELEHRRIAEKVTKSVEETLKKRYTWLAIVMSFVLGGGAALWTQQLVKPAERALTRHEVLLSEAEKSLDEVNEFTNFAREKVDSFQKTIDELNNEINGVSEGKKTLNDRLIETLVQLDKVTQNVDNLRESVELLSQGKNISIEPSIDVSKNINVTLQKTRLTNYTIYIHYHDENDKARAKEISDHLKDIGYSVPDIRRVQYKVNDIRYYHKEDQDAAFQLLENVNKFIHSLNVKPVDLSPQYLGDRYSNVRKGVIELWLSFS
jgi:septal ring factor EnvC (AmiA/AmiB activator)